MRELALRDSSGVESVEPLHGPETPRHEIRLGAFVALRHKSTETVPTDDLQVEQAMRVYDEALNDQERREVFRSLYRAVTAYRHSGDIDHLIRLAESVDGMVVHETNQPGVREKMRNAPKTAREAGGVVEAAEVIRQLRE